MCRNSWVTNVTRSFLPGDRRLPRLRRLLGARSFQERCGGACLCWSRAMQRTGIVGTQGHVVTHLFFFFLIFVFSPSGLHVIQHSRLLLSADEYVTHRSLRSHQFSPSFRSRRSSPSIPRVDDRFSYSLIAQALQRLAITSGSPVEINPPRSLAG